MIKTNIVSINEEFNVETFLPIIPNTGEEVNCYIDGDTGQPRECLIVSRVFHLNELEALGEVTIYALSYDR